MNLSLPWTWSWEPIVLLALTLAAMLYMVGCRGAARRGQAEAASRWRVVAYCCGLLAILVAWVSPLAAWSRMSLTAQVIQQEVLLFVAAPLLVLSAPRLSLWYALPQAMRQRALCWGLRHPRVRRVLACSAAALTIPAVVWGLFVGDFVAWHVPALFDVALGNAVPHDVEGLCLLGTSVLFWGRIIPAPQGHATPARMAYGARAAYVSLALAALMLVALVFIVSPMPIYASYVAHHVAGGPGALIDQATAGGFAGLSIGAILVVIAALVVWRWLGEEAERPLTLPPGLRMRPITSVAPPTRQVRRARWTPIVLRGGAAARGADAG